jgi:hypothetical protein
MALSSATSATVVAPFTTNRPSVAPIADLLREGRGCGGWVDGKSGGFWMGNGGLMVIIYIYINIIYYIYILYYIYIIIYIYYIIWVIWWLVENWFHLFRVSDSESLWVRLFGDFLGDLIVILNGLYMGLYSHNGDVIIHNLMGNLYGFCMDYMMDFIWNLYGLWLNGKFLWITYGLYMDCLVI